jgi:serine protease inhibitor
MPTATASFALRLLEHAAADGNVVLSPASVQNALVALRPAVSGATREALDTVPDPQLRPIDDEGVVLELAQAVWVDQRVELLADLGIDAFTLDFGAPEAAARVNGWASEKTHGMVPRILDAFSPSEIFALTDAAYFEGSWAVPFQAERTEPRPFTRPAGDTVDVPMMHGDGRYEYYEDEAVQAVRLPYGNQHELCFTAVIAREGLAPPPIDAWDALETRKRTGSIAIPRFSAQSSLELSTPLKALGLERAFTPSSDFDGLISGAAKAISRVLHSARVDVDEQGTRAAAVTLVAIEMTAVYGGEPFELRLDRPFLWAVENRRTGTILFMGIVTDPGEEST